MRTITKPIAALLAVLTALPILASCSQNNASPEKTDDTTPAVSNTDTVTVASSAETDPVFDDGLPNDVSYNGYTFRIGAEDTTKEWINYIYVEEQNGETVNDAVYDANLVVSERFNVEFEHIPFVNNNWGCYDEIKNNVQSGVDAYDIITMHDCQSAKLAQENVFLNVHEIPHIDITKPWWPAYTVESLTVNGKMYTIANSMSYYGLYSTRVLFFNLGMLEDMHIEAPYQAVRDGTWYFDDLIEMTKDVYSDLDMDGRRSLGDRYGFALTGGAYCFLESFGIETFGKNENGTELVLNFNNEYTFNALTKSCEWFYSGSEGVYYSKTHSDYFAEDSALTMFGNGNVLSAFNSVGRLIKACLTSDVVYGIVPMPKLDETQKDYISGCVDNPVCVPTTNKDPDRTGMIIEAMSAQGYYKVQPAYKEIALKDRYATDKDSSEMLDIIFKNRMLSAGYLYGTGGLQMWHETIWQYKSMTPPIASLYKKGEKTYQQQIDKLNKFFSQQ